MQPCSRGRKHLVQRGSPVLLTLTTGNVPEETPGILQRARWQLWRRLLEREQNEWPCSKSQRSWAWKFCTVYASAGRSRCLPSQLTVTNRSWDPHCSVCSTSGQRGHSFPGSTATVVVWELLGSGGPSCVCKRAGPRSKWNSTIFKTLLSIRSSQQIWPVCLTIVKSPCKNHQRALHLRWQSGASLVTQWWRIHLPMQETWVWSLVWEHPTCCGAPGPKYPNYWAWATTTEAHAGPRARTPWGGKPLQREAWALQLQKNAHSSEDPSQPKIN